MLGSAIFWKLFRELILIIEFLVLYFIINTFFVSKYKTIFNIFGLVFIAFVISVISWFEINIFIKVIFEILMTFVYCYKNYTAKLRKMITLSLLYWIFLISLDSLSMIIITLLDRGSNYNEIYKNTSSSLKAFILSKVLLIFSTFLCKRIKFFEFVCISIITNVFGLILVVACENKVIIENPYSNGVMIFLVFLILASNVFLVFIIKKLIEDNKKIIRYEIESKYTFMENDYYRRMEENNKQIRQLYHDMRNHLFCIGGLCESEDAKEYINNLNLELNKLDNKFDTGNKVLNLILSEKKYVCIKNNITFRVYADFSISNAVKVNDVCTLFGNIIDNAIEACIKIDDDIEKIIELKVKYIKGFCVIKITNVKKNKIRMDGNNFISDKENGKSHGIGLKNVREIVDKYKGELLIDYTEDRFNLTIVFLNSDIK